MPSPTKAAAVVRLAGVCALLALSGAAGAQPASPATEQSLAGRVDQRLVKLHDALGITPPEEPLWGEFAQVTRINAQTMRQTFARRHGALATMSALDNVESLADTANQHAQNMQRLATAFQRLYAAMPPEQKHVADDVFRAHSERAGPAEK